MAPTPSLASHYQFDKNILGRYGNSLACNGLQTRAAPSCPPTLFSAEVQRCQGRVWQCIARLDVQRHPILAAGVPGRAP